ncbi:MAG: choice-of-anchor D domain-containing protein, partial [Bdellovibrionia bacterium]
MRVDRTAKVNIAKQFANFAVGIRATYFLAVLFLLNGCSGGAGNKEISSGNLGLTIISANGDNQFADPGQKFRTPLVAKVVDPLGKPVPGVSVTFSSESKKDFQLLDTGLTTDGAGAAAANIIAPSELNAEFIVYASLPGGSPSVAFLLHTYPEQLLIISDGPTYSYGTQAIGSEQDYSFVLSNTGTKDATNIFGQVKDLPFKFKGGNYPGVGGNCSTSLAGGANCVMVVSFAPTALTFETSQIDVHYKDGEIERVVTRPVQGTGANLGKLVISDDPRFDYGPIAVGGTVDHTFSIDNIGTLDATAITSVGMSADFAFKGGTFPGAGGTCGATIQAGTTCSVIVEFHPQQIGLAIDKIDLSYFNGATPDRAEREIQGTGATPALLNISDGPTYDYGQQAVNSATDKVFTVANNGNSPATALASGSMLAPFRFKGNVYPGTGGSCTNTLAPGATCTISVTYSPTSAGTHTGAVNLNYFNGAMNLTATRPVVGIGADLGLLSISNPPFYDYGMRPLNSFNDFTFTVTNTGTGAVTAAAGAGLGAPFTFKGGTYPGSGGSCGANIGAGISCTVVVTYNPTTTGLHSDTIQIDYNDGSQIRNALRDVQGTGLSNALINISNAPLYDYGTRAVATTTDFTFTVDNSGAVMATGITGTGLAAPFDFKGGSYPGTGGNCGAALAPAGVCSIVVTYSPTAAGVHSDTIDLNYDDGAGAQTSSRNIQGTATNQAVLTISDNPLYDFGTKSLGSVSEKIFTV